MAVKRREFCKLAGLSVVGATWANTSSEGTTIEAPLEAKRWAMVVDLQACRREDGCRDCIRACHEAHNVPHFPNPKDEVKWIWKEPFEKAFPNQEHPFLRDGLEHEHVPVFCNHCDNPPCTRVCPTQATWKRPDGIVMMDWHRCIGCRYCVAACPYGSRSFNWRDPRPFIPEIRRDFPTRTRGVVEKCTFCDERLAQGRMPACVEACTSGCLTFGDLEDAGSEVRELLEERYSIRRKAGLGTQPEVYYLV
jgi:molybdopterin-containing oxidoreductase family iron-sulfur binding subunit